MARGEEITTKYNLDVSGFKKGISEANKNIKLANAQFKAASAGMDDWSKSSEGIKAKLTQLGTELTEQNKKLDNYKKQQNEIDKAYQENGKRADELKAKLTQLANQGVSRTSEEYKKYKKALTEVEKEMAGNKKASDDLKVTILNQQATVSRTEKEISNYEDSLKDVQKAEKMAAKSGKSVEDSLKEIANEADNADENLNSIASTLAGGIKKGFTAIAGAAIAAVGGFLTLGEATQETVEDMGKLETAFSAAGHSSETAQKTYKGFVGILGETDQSVEAVNHLAKLTKNEEELAKWTNIAAGVYGTFGDSLPIEGLTEAANETAKVGQVTGPLADALNWAGISEDKFNESLKKCNSEQERAALITEVLNRVYDDAATKYKEVNADLIKSREATANMQSAMAELGQKATPITTAFKNGFTEILVAVTELIGGLDSEAIATKIKDGFTYFVDTILPAIKDGLNWISENKDTIIAGIAGIGAAFVAWNVVSMIQNVVNAMKGMTVAQAALNLVMSLNPVGLVVAAIAGLVTAFVVLWNKSDSFRNFWIGLWENIQSITGTVVSAIGNFFTKTIPEAIEKAVGFFTGIPDKISSGLTKAKDKVTTWGSNVISSGKEKLSTFVNNTVTTFSSVASKIGTPLANAVSKVGSWGATMITKGLEAAKGLVDTVVNAIKGIPTGISDVGLNIVEGLWNGINNSISWITEKVKEFAGGILEGMKEALGVASPSKEAAKIGKFVDEGLAKGIEDNSNIPNKKVQEMADSLINSMGESINTNTEKIANDFVAKLLENIRKKLDVTKVYNKLTLAEEMDYWNKSRLLFKEGTDERVESDKEYFELREEMLENLTELEEDFNKELEKIEQNKIDTYKKLQKKKVDLTNDYNKNIKKLESNLKSEIENLWNNYYNKVNSRASEIAKSFNLFDSVNLSESANKNVLLDNLSDQVNAIEEYQAAMKTLESRNMSDALKEQLKGLNVSSLNQLKEVLSMSDEELKEYDRLYNSKIKLSQQIATEEYQELYTSTKNEVSALRDNISKQLGKAHADYYRQITEINRDVSNAFMTYQSELQKANNVYLAAINELGITAKNGMNDITVLMSDSAKEIGQALNDGVIESLEKNKSAFYGRIRSYFSNIVAEVKAELDINSPSKVMEKQVGKNMILGVAQGIKNNLSAVNDSFKPLQNSADNLNFGGNGVVSGRNTVINFTQNNNSPKALSRQEIYRQTNNALLRLQGV